MEGHWKISLESLKVFFLSERPEELLMGEIVQQTYMYLHTLLLCTFDCPKCKKLKQNATFFSCLQKIH